jgi:hypothetical protein
MFAALRERNGGNFEFAIDELLIGEIKFSQIIKLQINLWY